MPDSPTAARRIADAPPECECVVFLDRREEGCERIHVETTDCPVHSPELIPAFVARDV
jgi:hypothetical protein